MTQINIENVAGLASREAVLPDRGRLCSQPPGAESFGSHFCRVQALPKATIAGSQPDSARLSQPPALPPEAPQRFTEEREPAADDPRSDPQDAADVAADESAAGCAADEAASENEPTGTADAQSDPEEDRQPSETAQPASQTRPGQETETDPGANEPQQDDPRQAPARLSLHPHSEAGKKALGQSASEQTASGQGEGVNGASQHAAAKEEAAETDAAAEDLPAQAANQAGPLLKRLCRQNTAAAISGAAEGAQAADETAAEQADAPGSGSRPGKKGIEADKPGGGQDSTTPASQAGILFSAPLPGAKEDTAGEQVGRPAKPQPNHAALAAAADFRAATAAAAKQSAGAEDEQPSRAGDPRLQAPEDPAKPPPTAVADGRLNAPLRISPGHDARALPTQQSQQSAESVEGDGARFVQRVARAFQAVGKSSGSIRLRLSPPELGSLRLEITVRNGLLTARMEAETPTARNLLLDNLPALRERLAQQEIKVKQFDVALMDRSPGGSAEQMADHTQSQHRQGNHIAARPSGDADRSAAPAFVRATVNRPGEGTQLNVVI